MYYCYIIYSESRDSYYIGACQDIKKRLEDHNNSRTPSTKSGKPWVLKWHKEFETRSEALAEERRLKQKKSRKYLEFLISSAEQSVPTRRREGHRFDSVILHRLSTGRQDKAQQKCWAFWYFSPSQEISQVGSPFNQQTAPDPTMCQICIAAALDETFS